MKKIEKTIFINTDVNSIWKAIVDTNSWNKWSNDIKKVNGQFIFGEDIELVMNNHSYRAQVVELNPPYGLKWQAKMLSTILFTNERTIELVKKGEGTEVHLTESFSGLMVPLFWPKMKKHVPNVLDKSLSGLKLHLDSSS